MDDRIAKSEEDVRRLAPTPGYYRLRGPRDERGAVFFRNIRIDRLGRESSWWVLAINPGATADDDFALGMEIVGPIPEPD